MAAKLSSTDMKQIIQGINDYLTTRKLCSVFLMDNHWKHYKKHYYVQLQYNLSQ